MQTYEVELKPKGFIQSFQNQNPSFPSSTTLFGAICWAIRAIYEENTLEGFLDNFTSDSRFFILSSTFPLLKGNGLSLRCFPKPKIKGLTPQEMKEVAGGGNKQTLFSLALCYKSFKKVPFVSESLFFEVLQGKQERELFEDYISGKIKKEGDFLLTEEEYKHTFDAKPRELKRGFASSRNKIDRFTSSTSGTGEFFYDFRLSCSPQLSSFFLLRTEEISFLKPAFKYLEDSGIGGERAIGANQFSIKVKETTLNFPHGGRKLVILSRWRADPKELDIEKKEDFHYELLPLRAKLETGFDFKDKAAVWKQKTIYFVEGSILVAKEKCDYYGALWQSLEVGNKRIRDNGIAFPAFFKE